MNKHFFNMIVLTAVLAWPLAACTGSPITPTPTAVPVQNTATTIPPTSTTLPTATPTDKPTETPEPTASPTPTLDFKATAQAEATQAAEAAIAEIGKELETVGLSTDTGYLLWAQEEPVAVELNEYDEWISYNFADGLVASDFVILSEITWDSTSGLVACGFFFRSEKNLQKGKQYVYEMYRLSSLPAIDITFRQYGEFQKSLSKYQTSSAIDQDQGSTNKIVLVAEGEKLTLYINDIRVGSFYDYSKSMEEGYFAYSAWQESGESICTFDRTWVWALK